MSRGPGSVEHTVEAVLMDNPSSTFTVEDLARLTYPGLDRIEKKHRVSVIRAATKVANRCGWCKWKVKRFRPHIVFFDPLRFGVAYRRKLFMHDVQRRW